MNRKLDTAIIQLIEVLIEVIKELAELYYCGYKDDFLCGGVVFATAFLFLSHCVLPTTLVL